MFDKLTICALSVGILIGGSASSQTLSGTCPNKGVLPDWVSETKPALFWKQNLRTGLYTLKRRSAVVETRDCSCDTSWPDYNDFKEEMDALVQRFEGEPYADIRGARQHFEEISQGANDLFQEYQSICSEQTGGL